MTGREKIFSLQDEQERVSWKLQSGHSHLMKLMKQSRNSFQIYGGQGGDRE